MAVAGQITVVAWSPNVDDELHFDSERWVSDGQYPPTYSWQTLDSDIPMDLVQGPYQYLFNGSANDPLYIVGNSYRATVYKRVHGDGDEVQVMQGLYNAY